MNDVINTKLKRWKRLVAPRATVASCVKCES
jgi:hypothetical protein